MSAENTLDYVVLKKESFFLWYFFPPDLWYCSSACSHLASRPKEGDGVLDYARCVLEEGLRLQKYAQLPGNSGETNAKHFLHVSYLHKPEGLTSSTRFRSRECCLLCPPGTGSELCCECKKAEKELVKKHNRVVEKEKPINQHDSFRIVSVYSLLNLSVRDVLLIIHPFTHYDHVDSMNHWSGQNL